MPVLNEERYLSDAVMAILRQNYQGRLRIVLSVGPSDDETLSVAKNLVNSNSQIILVESPTGRTPDSLNLAISHCTEEIIVRVDAHAELSENYIEMAVETLQRTNADNVGGVMGAKGLTNFEKAVAAAMTSPLGVGSVPFHTGGIEGPAETVYLGVFKRSALERVGGYDPKFTRAQDWELNHRIRSSGGLIWFNPKLIVTYRPRPNLKKLAKQYFQYGTWRRQVMRSHPETKIRISAIRYFAPPLALLGIILGLMIGLIGVVRNSWLIFGFIAPVGYLAITLFSSLYMREKADSGANWLPLVLATMQLSWGLGFLLGRHWAR